MEIQQEVLISLFDGLSRVSSRKEKERLLTEAFKTPYAEVLKQAFVLALDPYATFGVVAIEQNIEGLYSVPTWETFVLNLRKLETRECAGSEARAVVESLTSTSDTTWNKWSARIINKDLRIGVGAKTLNKVAGYKFIREFEIALCEAFDPNAEGNENLPSLFGRDYFIEPKLNGWRCVAHVKEGKVVFYSRKGKTIANTQFVEADLLKLGVTDVIFDGELVASSFQQTEMILGADVNPPHEDIVKQLKFYIFDQLEAEYFFSQGSKGNCKPLHSRKVHLLNLEPKLGSYLALVPYDEFDPTSLAQYGKHVESGYEGSILKRKDLQYGFSRSASDWHKIKPLKEADFTVVGFEEGTSKHAGILGAILAEGEIEGKRVKVAVGSGFSDELRKEVWNNKDNYLNRLIEVGYQEITKAKDSEVWSLQFPRFHKFKNDR